MKKQTVINLVAALLAFIVGVSSLDFYSGILVPAITSDHGLFSNYDNPLSFIFFAVSYAATLLFPVVVPVVAFILIRGRLSK